MNALVVSCDPTVFGPIGDALVNEGWDVTVCRGPHARTYVCPGGCDGHCPLPSTADVVVLDCDLASDEAGQGTRSWQLLEHYRGRGLPVVALASAEDLSTTPVLGGRVLVLPRHGDPARVLAAVVNAA